MMISLSTFYQSSSSKRTLVLLHAFPLSSAMWESASEIISSASPDHSIVFANFPGFGNAPVKNKWTLTEAIADLGKKLSDERILRPVIGGLSMGGYAAFAYYRLFPNDVSAMILSNTKPGADSEEAKKGREEYARDVEKRGVEAVYERQLGKLISDVSKKRNPNLVSTLKSWISSASSEAIAAGLRTMAARDDSSDLLQKISCPTLVITGENDAIIPPEEMKSFSKNISHSQFNKIAEVGHLSAVENPEEWGHIVSEFLNRL